MKTTEDKIKLVSNLITVTGIFCLAISLLLLVNFIHIRTSKPLESEALKALVERFQNDSQNEQLKNEIRNLDLLARKAFFTSDWQVKTGGLLLLLGGVLFGILLRIYHDMKAKIGLPLITGGTTQITRLLSQRWILITGGLLLGSALTASYLTTDFLKIYRETGQVVQQTPQEAEEGVRTVELEEEVTSETVTSDTVTSDIVTSEAVTSESVTSESVTSGGVTSDTVTIEAVTSEAVTSEAVTSDGLVVVRKGAVTRHPSFRGHWGQGLSDATNVPVDWDGPTGRNIKWKVTLEKPGYNSPIIWDDKVFIAGADASARVVYCYDRHTGTLIWKHEATGIPGSPSAAPRVTSDTGLSAPTVATDGTRVYAIFATGDLVAVSFSGQRAWARNLGVPNNHYGHSSSLICHENSLIVQYDTNNGGKLLALNTATGETLWETPRPTKISWASPLIARLNDKLQVITVTSPVVYGNDFTTGAELWSIDCLGGEVGASAAVLDGLVFAANEYARLVAINPYPNPVIVWESDEYLPEAASPAAANGLLFVATSYGILACYDAPTGHKLWEEEYGQGFYGSPMIAENKVYIMDRSGTMHIFSLNRAKTNLGNPVLGEKSVVTPAFTDGALYLRGEKTLFCIGTQ